MKTTNVGQYLFNSILPKKYRDDKRNFHDKKMLKALLTQMARELPHDEYAKILRDVFKLGADVTYYEGSSFSLDDLKVPPRTKAARKKLYDDVQKILAGPGTKKEKDEKVIKHVQKNINVLQEVMMKETDELDSGLAKQVRSGSRGKPGDLQSLILGDMLMEDAKGNAIPIPLLHGYAEGVDPAEYFSNSFGTRIGVLSTKKSVADAGYLAKRIKQVAHRQVVTTKDCGTQRSIEVDTNDPDNIGALLAHDTEGYKAGTPITTTMLKRLKAKTIDIRSPITCDAPEGLCSHCAGIREHGEFPDIGENVGIIAGQSVGEGSIQASLCLHKGTLVRMADLTVKEIQDIEVGDLVIGSTISGDLKPVRVLNTFYQGEQEVYEYVYKKGKTKEYVRLEATENHKLLSNTSKSSCKEAMLNDTVRLLNTGYKCSKTFAVLQQGIYEPPGVINEPMALAAGLLYGDGCRSETTPIISCADSSQMRDLDVELAKVGMHSVKRQRKYDWALALKDAKGTATRGLDGKFISNESGTSRNPLIALQERLDTRLKYCHEKQLSEEILLTWDTDSVCRLIAGYFASDGSIFRNKSNHVYIAFGSTSRQLLEGFKFLLDTRLGLHSSKIYDTRRSKKETNHDFYELKLNRLTEVQRFNELIGPYVPGVKRERMSRYVREAKYIGSQPFFRARRVEQNFLGVLPCFDIEVEHPDHLFLLANGLTVSNSKKHSAGRATGEEKDKFVSGYELIEQLMAVPKHYPDAATVATLDGVVDSVEKAPQGGFNVIINGEKLHVPQKMAVTVKVGDHVEAGDLLSDGLPDPSKLVKYRGIGEARRLFTKQLREATGANRRNTEIVAKAFIDYVKVTDPDLLPNAAPDDIIKYSDVAKTWKPRKGYTVLDPSSAVGKYLETPASQYTIGTRISRRVAKDLENKGFEAIDVHPEAPPFEAITVPSSRALTNASDWQERMGGYYLRQSLMDAASSGMKSDVSSTSFIPGILKGTEFGKELRETGKY